MDSLDILILFVTFFLVTAVVLFYFTKKEPVKKLNIQSLPSQTTEVSQELTIQYPEKKVLEYIPEIPEEYGENNLTVLVRDPYWLYLYWSFSEDLKNALQAKFGSWDGTLPVLQVFNASNFDNPVKLFDVTINESASNWYLKVPENTTLLIRLVRLYSNGQTVTVLSSNVVKTPRAFMSDVFDEEWMLVGDNQKKLYKRIGVGKGPSSPDFYNPRI